MPKFPARFSLLYVTLCTVLLFVFVLVATITGKKVKENPKCWVVTWISLQGKPFIRDIWLGNNCLEKDTSLTLMRLWRKWREINSIGHRCQQSLIEVLAIPFSSHIVKSFLWALNTYFPFRLCVSDVLGAIGAHQSHEISHHK